MVKVFCDKCGKELDEHCEKTNFYIGLCSYRCDLCLECKAKYYEESAKIEEEYDTKIEALYKEKASRLTDLLGIRFEGEDNG